jgi:hypothetical protein
MERRCKVVATRFPTSAKTLRTTTARIIEYFSSMLGLIVISAMSFLGFGSGSSAPQEIHRSHD